MQTARRADLILLLTLGLALGLWAWLAAAQTFVDLGDEALYIYGGKLLAQGHVPYADFFLAHPPLRMLLSGALFALGLPAVASKGLAMVATAGNTVLIATLARRVSGSWAGVAATLLWITASLTLDTGRYFIGSNLATSFVLGACVLAAYGRHGWAGAMLGLGAHQALYALLPGPVLLWWAWRDGQVRRFVLGGLTWPVGVLLAWLTFGDAYFMQTVGYHLKKVGGQPAPYPTGRIVSFFAVEWAPVVFGLSAWLAKTGHVRRVAALGLQTLAVVCAYRALQTHYFIIPLALLSAAGGCGAVALVERMRAGGTGSVGATGGINRRVVMAGLVLALIWALAAIPHVHHAGVRRAYQPVVGAELAALTAKIEARPPKSGLLWGDSAVTAALSLRTGLPIAQHFVDTNAQRFDAGLADAAAVNRDVLDGDKPGVLMVARHGIFKVDAIRRHVEQTYLAQFVFPGPAMGYDVVYLLRGSGAARAR
ncbi:MAG: hypothetical protein KC502_22095 [Myxococcales bacterium]|nr:hypothetical protein [Myxococcales bacterium]